MTDVCVFCGSTPGTDPAFTEAAFAVGAGLADAGLGLVYGGGNGGLMGSVSDGALSRGGRVVGVIPEALMAREWGRTDLDQLHVVEGMHQRKALMYELSGAFITLPGGLGTFDEFFETVTWTKLGLHRKPAFVLNVGGYYDPLQSLLEHALTTGFFTHGDQDQISFFDDVDALLGAVVEFSRIDS